MPDNCVLKQGGGCGGGQGACVQEEGTLDLSSQSLQPLRQHDVQATVRLRLLSASPEQHPEEPPRVRLELQALEARLVPGVAWEGGSCMLINGARPPLLPSLSTAPAVSRILGLSAPAALVLSHTSLPSNIVGPPNITFSLPPTSLGRPVSATPPRLPSYRHRNSQEICRCPAGPFLQQWLWGGGCQGGQAGRPTRLQVPAICLTQHGPAVSPQLGA